MAGELGGAWSRTLVSCPQAASCRGFPPGSSQAPSPCFLVADLQTLTHPLPPKPAQSLWLRDRESLCTGSVPAQQLMRGLESNVEVGSVGLGPRPLSRDAAEPWGVGASLVGEGRQELRRGTQEKTTDGPAGGRPDSRQTMAKPPFTPSRARAGQAVFQGRPQQRGSQEEPGHPDLARVKPDFRERAREHHVGLWVCGLSAEPGPVPAPTKTPDTAGGPGLGLTPRSSPSPLTSSSSCPQALPPAGRAGRTQECWVWMHPCSARGDQSFRGSSCRAGSSWERPCN